MEHCDLLIVPKESIVLLSCHCAKPVGLVLVQDLAYWHVLIVLGP